MNAYRKLCTEFYDTDKPRAQADALDFYLSYAAQAQGPILEPMCGSGRFLMPLLERGFDIEGVDASPHMLSACRESCARRGLVPKLHEQFMHELRLERQFALAFIPASSFRLLDRPVAREFLGRLSALLLRGAKFVLEVPQRRSPTSYAGPWGGRWVERADGAKIIISWLTHYDAEERYSRSIHRYELVKDGRLIETEFEDFCGPAYDQEEVCDMLASAGFGAIQTWKLYANTPPDPTDEDIVIECSKL